MWVSKTLLHQGERNDIKIFSKSENGGLRVASSTIVALDSINNEARVVVMGLQTTAVTDTSPSSSDQLIPKRICYHLEFQPDLDLLGDKEKSEYCSNISGSLTADRDEVVEDVELACFLSFSTALPTISQDLLPSSKLLLVKYLAWKCQLERYSNGSLLHGGPEWKALVSNFEYQGLLFERVLA